jgi:hypothetical protein
MVGAKAAGTRDHRTGVDTRIDKRQLLVFSRNDLTWIPKWQLDPAKGVDSPVAYRSLENNNVRPGFRPRCLEHYRHSTRNESPRPLLLASVAANPCPTPDAKNQKPSSTARRPPWQQASERLGSDLGLLHHFVQSRVKSSIHDVLPTCRSQAPMKMSQNLLKRVKPQIQ